jgi:heme/copper-type cytochrome/quinol oxidase subunit 3
VRDVYFFIKCKLNPDFAVRYEEEQNKKNTTANVVNQINALQPYLEIISDAQLFLVATILLAFEFTCCQLIEYYTALFYINDGIYGSTFYVATGFHGLHVLIGSIFLFICFLRMYAEHFLVDHHVGFEMAI